MSVLIMIAFMENTVLVKLINKLPAFIKELPAREYSLSLYLTHMFIRTVFAEALNRSETIVPYQKVMIGYIIASLIWAAICVVIVRLGLKAFKRGN